MAFKQQITRGFNSLSGRRISSFDIHSCLLCSYGRAISQKGFPNRGYRWDAALLWKNRKF